MLHGVHIVASQTSHCRGSVAAAFFQQFDLAAVHIKLHVWSGPRQFKVLVERFAWNVGERWGKRHPEARMAPGAEVHLSFARKSCRITYG